MNKTHSQTKCEFLKVIRKRIKKFKENNWEFVEKNELKDSIIKKLKSNEY